MPGQQNPFDNLSKFEILSDQMFFNIFIHKPDQLVIAFIKKYYPAFAKKYKPTGWTIYPPGPFPEYEYTVHSFKFRKHPFFDAPYKEGRLDILSMEEKNGRPGVTDFHLWFLFHSKKDATTGFKILCKMFDQVSNHKKVSEFHGRRKAEYADLKVEVIPNDVEFVLAEHELYKGRYKLFFRLGAYTYSDSYNFGYVNAFQRPFPLSAHEPAHDSQ